MYTNLYITTNQCNVVKLVKLTKLVKLGRKLMSLREMHFCNLVKRSHVSMVIIPKKKKNRVKDIHLRKVERTLNKS